MSRAWQIGSTSSAFSKPVSGSINQCVIVDLFYLVLFHSLFFILIAADRFILEEWLFHWPEFGFLALTLSNNFVPFGVEVIFLTE